MVKDLLCCVQVFIAVSEAGEKFAAKVQASAYSRAEYMGLKATQNCRFALRMSQYLVSPCISLHFKVKFQVDDFSWMCGQPLRKAHVGLQSLYRFCSWPLERDDARIKHARMHGPKFRNLH